MAQIILGAIGWPHVALIFALAFCLIFRAQVASLLSRVTSIDKTGIRTQPVPEAQREEQNKDPAQELLVAIGNSIVLTDVENKIRGELTARGLNVNSAEAVPVTVKLLALARILNEFEQIHNLIFGSQIWLLKKLNEVTGQGRPKQFIERHFTNVQSKFPDALATWNVDQYLEFLVGRSLVTQNGDVYHITNLGVEYLTWMVRAGRSEQRNL